MSGDRLSRSANSPFAPSADARERVVQALCLHFASDRLSLDTLEDRLERAYRATSMGQLDDLLADLPTLANDKSDPGGVPLLAPPSAVPPRGVHLAVMGGSARKGSWVVPRHLKVIAFMGGADLDLRNARLAAGVTEIEVFVVMGGVQITVPPGVRVEAMGTAFMGGFETDAGDASALDQGQPVLRISGLAIMGGVDTRVRHPSKKMLRKFEAAWNASRRLGRGDDEG